MKKYFIYFVIAIAFFNCKQEREQNSLNKIIPESKKEVNGDDFLKVQQSFDTSKKKPKLQNLDVSKVGLDTLRKSLIGKIFKSMRDIDQFRGLTRGGYLIEDIYGDMELINGKTYSMKIFSDYNDNVLYMVMSYRVLNDQGERFFKIIDLLELEKETKVYQEIPNNKIIISSKILLNEQLDIELFALAAWEEDCVLSEVYKIWRANRAKEKIEEVIDWSGIKVLNEDCD